LKNFWKYATTNAPVPWDEFIPALYKYVGEPFPSNHHNDMVATQKYDPYVQLTKGKKSGDEVDPHEREKRLYDTLFVLFNNICGRKQPISADNFGKFLAWFGDPTQGFFDRLTKFISECAGFFHACCSNPNAIVGKNNGHFLVRFSLQKPGAFVLAYYLDSTKFREVLIKQKNGKFRFRNLNGKPQKVDNLKEIITYFAANKVLQTGVVGPFYWLYKPKKKEAPPQKPK